jgi:hypothetical protein
MVGRSLPSYRRNVLPRPTRLTAALLSASLKLVTAHEGNLQRRVCTTEKCEVGKLQSRWPQFSGENGERWDCRAWINRAQESPRNIPVPIRATPFTRIRGEFYMENSPFSSLVRLDIYLFTLSQFTLQARILRTQSMLQCVLCPPSYVITPQRCNIQPDAS